MKIRNTYFNVQAVDVVKELKTQLSARGIQRFARIEDGAEDVMTCCPYHNGGQEQNPSCGIRKADGVVHCFACDARVGLDMMISNCFGYTDASFGYQWLVRNFLTVEVSKREVVKVDMARNHISSPRAVLDTRSANRTDMLVSEEELAQYRQKHPYMYERGLTDEVIEKFDIGYDQQTDSITFPVRWWGAINNGKTMFVARRQVTRKRFDIPKGQDKPLYGLFEIWNEICENRDIERIDKVYVCEGLFDCLRLWCNGKYAVAGFGCLFSEWQITLLQGLPTRVLVLALDNDKAGQEARQKLRKAIKRKLIYDAIIPEGKKDIGELTDDEIQNLEERL